jgi:transcriptional regulator with XRE-family HTH domain
MAGRFGALLKELRLKRDQTLREFCARNGFDPGNYSKLERGLFAPPGEGMIAKYAKALGVEVGSDTYVEMLDLASVDRGELPRDFLTDKQLLDELPLLFRTIRGEAATEDKLDRLVQLLRSRNVASSPDTCL